MQYISYAGRGVEAEGRDRKNMSLPGQQLKLLQDAVEYGKSVKRTCIQFRVLVSTQNAPNGSSGM